MIDREKINKFLDAMDQLSEEDADMTIDENGAVSLQVYPKNWWGGARWNEEKRHKMLALLTPLVGTLAKYEDGGNIGYRGDKPGVTIRLAFIDKCKILGYRTVTKTVRKEIEREPEFETEEVEERIAITDCDVKRGRFKEEDIEVPA